MRCFKFARDIRCEVSHKIFKLYWLFYFLQLSTYPRQCGRYEPVNPFRIGSVTKHLKYKCRMPENFYAPNDINGLIKDTIHKLHIK